MSSSIRLARAVSLALLFAAGPACADQFDWSLYGGIEHSDNINLVATAPTSQWLLIPGFGFDYSRQGSVLQAQVTGGAEYLDYLGGSYSNQKFGQLAGMANWTVVPQRLDFVAEDYAGVQPVSVLATNSPDNQQQINVLSLGPTLHFNLGSALLGELDLRYTNSQASRTTEFDSSRGEAALRLTRDISPTSQLSVNLDSQKVDFDDSNGFDDDDEIGYHQDEAFLRYVSKLAKLDLNVDAGWSRVSLDDGAGSDASPLVRINVNWHATASNLFGIAFSRSYSDAAQDLIDQVAPLGSDTHSVVPLGIQTGDQAIGSGIFLERRLQANYSYSSDLFTVTLSPWYRKLHYLQVGSQPDESGRGGDANVDYRLNARTTLSGFVTTEREDYEALARRDTTSSVGVALRRFINQHWSWRVSLDNLRQSSTATGFDYHANEVYCGVVYQR